jgi:hypothetical protein
MPSNPISKYKIILFPVGVVLAMIILAFVVGSFLLGRIGQVRSEIQTLGSEKAVLDTRLSTLQAIDPQITQSVNFVSLAVPEKNPSVFITKQLRTLATKWSVTLADLSITTQAAESVDLAEPVVTNNHEIGFEAVGTVKNIFDFITNLSEIIPLVNISSVNLKAPVGDRITAQIRLNSQSAPFPKELPALHEPLVGLTESEQETLRLLETFEAPPAGVSTSTSSGVQSRANPYAPL